MALSLLWAIVCIVLAVAAVAFVVCCVYASVVIIKNYSYNFPTYNPFASFDFSRSAAFADMGRISGGYFKSLFLAAKSVWTDIIYACASNINNAGGYRILSFKKWLLYISSLAMPVMALVISAVIVVALTVAFIPVIIAQAALMLFTLIFRMR